MSGRDHQKYKNFTRYRQERDGSSAHLKIAQKPTPDTPPNHQPITTFGMDSEYRSYVNSHGNIRLQSNSTESIALGDNNNSATFNIFSAGSDEKFYGLPG